MKKNIMILIGIAILIGWLVPIDGPFDIKPNQVIEQYKKDHNIIEDHGIIKKKHLCCPGPVMKPTRELTEDELELLEEQYDIIQIDEISNIQEYQQ